MIIYIRIFVFIFIHVYTYIYIYMSLSRFVLYTSTRAVSASAAIFWHSASRGSKQRWLIATLEASVGVKGRGMFLFVAWQGYFGLAPGLQSPA